MLTMIGLIITPSNKNCNKNVTYISNIYQGWSILHQAINIEVE